MHRLLSECLILEINLKRKKGYLVSLYRSPNQNLDEFELFLTNLENLLADISSRNPHFLLLLGDFNAKSKSVSIMIQLFHYKTKKRVFFPQRILAR